MNNKEIIAVINTKNIFIDRSYQEGIFAFDPVIITTILTHQEEMYRYEAEENFQYQQIISYIIFKYRNSFFLMQRKSMASEKNLHNKYTLGIGGHLHKEDLHKDIVSWGMREFHEEISYHEDFHITPIAMINDQSNMIGRLHFGIVYLMEGKTDNITIKSELKSGQLFPIDQCYQEDINFESWTLLFLDFYKNKLS